MPFFGKALPLVFVVVESSNKFNAVGSMWAFCKSLPVQ
jgi:hypothetical protein